MGTIVDDNERLIQITFFRDMFRFNQKIFIFSFVSSRSFSDSLRCKQIAEW